MQKLLHIPIAAARAFKADCLLTGDFRHFAHLSGRTLQGVLVVSQRLLSEEIITVCRIKSEVTILAQNVP